MAKIVGKNILGSNVSAPVVPFTTDDVVPTHEAIYGRGGWRYVATLNERDAIPLERRELRMIVCVGQDDCWTLKKGVTNNDWEKPEFAGEVEQIELIQTDWHQNDDKKIDFLKNKPTKLSDFDTEDFVRDPEGSIVYDPNYVRTEENFTTVLREKLDFLEAVRYDPGARINIYELREGNLIIRIIEAESQTEEDFTTILKTKLEMVEDAKYKGVFPHISALYSAWNPGELGWSADVITNVIDEDGNPEQILHRFAWDGLFWQDYGRLGFETPETIRIKYESLDISLANVNKVKLDTIEEGAQVNVQSDFLEDDDTSDAHIKNRPILDIELEDQEASDIIFATNKTYFANLFQPIRNFLKWTKEQFAALPIFVKDGDGTKFLSDNGEYKEIEIDLSEVDLKEFDVAIHTEDTETIEFEGDGSSESPLKAKFVGEIDIDLDKIGNLPIFEMDGDGTKFLSDDGTYKTIETGGAGCECPPPIEYEAGERITITDHVINADLQTDNNFTDTLREKLENLESPKYKGVFSSVIALQTAHPTGEIGDSADVIVEVLGTEGETVEEIRRFIWNGTQWEDKGTMGADTPEMIRQKYEGLETALANINKKRLDELNLMIESGELSGTVKTEDSSTITLTGDGSEDNPLKAEFIGVYVPGEGIPEVTTEDTNSIVFKGKGTPDDPLKAWHICGCCDGQGGPGTGVTPPAPEAPGRELKFIVKPDETREVSVFNALMHKALIIEYCITRDNLLQMGTMKISPNHFFQFDVMGDEVDIEFSWTGTRIVVKSTALADTEIHFKLNYFFKLD